jgi:glycosyl transferase, family 25
VKTAIYVVSLLESADRREQFTRDYAAAQAEVPWQFFDAHTTMSPRLRYSERDAIVAKGRALYPRELACYSSHYATWQKMLDEGADQLLVVEDDVVLDWRFVGILAALDLAKMGVNYLKLFNKNITPYKLVADNFHGRCLIDCRGFAHGMQAYMLTRAGAERFLAVCNPVRRPVDDEMDRSWSHGVPNLAVFPFPAFERQGASTIGKVRYEAHEFPADLSWSRIVMRLEEKWRRALQNVTGYGRIDAVSLNQE